MKIKSELSSHFFQQSCQRLFRFRVLHSRDGDAVQAELDG